MITWLHLRHTVVFTKTHPWSTICTCELMDNDQLYAESDLHLVYLGQDVYGEMREKPVLHNLPSIPVLPTHDGVSSVPPETLEPNIDPSTDDHQNDNQESSDEKGKHNDSSDHETSNTICGNTTKNQEQASSLLSILPPLGPIVLPLRLLIVNYLRTCTFPLVNPTIGNQATSPVHIDREQSQYSSSSASQTPPGHISVSNVKSENNIDFNLENILKSTAKNRKYSVLFEKLSPDDINLWTVKSPISLK